MKIQLAPDDLGKLLKTFCPDFAEYSGGVCRIHVGTRQIVLEETELQLKSRFDISPVSGEAEVSLNGSGAEATVRLA